MTRRQILSDPTIGNKAEAFEAFDDIPTNQNLGKTIGDVINARYGRRGVLRGMLGVTATTALFGTSALVAPGQARAETSKSRYAFDELTWGNDETHHVADGYDAKILLRWGDPILADAPEFDVMNQTAAAQLGQFGYNNDYVGFVALNDDGSRGLLCVNHEYTNEEVMFPGLGRQDRAQFSGMTPALIDIEMAAHGGSVVEIAKDGAGAWQVVRDGKMNRRITPLETAMTLDGPAAGHARMKTNDDPDGANVIGTLNNCAGGMTPWGTWLMAEENFHGYFWTNMLDDDGKPVIADDHPEAASYKRYGIPGMWYAWGAHHDRFNIDAEPHAPNKFGWVVEVDPMDPTSVPVKHTALGRFRHEGAETTVASDGRLVVYMGDDNRFDYQYKYVSAGKVSDDRSANSNLLSDGTLYVARFDADGTVNWLPLIHGEGPLTRENGFADQGDVMIDARIAADLLGATPMDRPEDAQPRGDGTAYIMLTNNTKRKPDQVNAANPRAESSFGHIIEIKEDGANHSATSGTWSILVKCGDPDVTEVGAQWNPDTTENGWFGSPDNCAIDADGRLWVATDQGGNWDKTGKSDGLYAVETEGDGRGTSKLFFRCPVGSEMCGPYFTDDGETLFVAVQHPGTDGTKNLAGFERESTFEDPATRWPDFDPKMPPRPSVVVITKQGGGKIAV
ncbi:PhoX family protein [Sulfitobacter sp.]|uniref:PhoX family protein n=1 Tax=Sulfitobacter sp. TaxID=1903071 RepID=UPI00405908C3|tara:strand:- start:882 stop:2912 length:2031 start_codon:yes stop_codon:yes gene_type:complete